MSQLSPYNLQAIYFNESVHEWILVIHTTIFTDYKLEVIEIEPNDFGFDSYAAMIIPILSNATSGDIMSAMRDQLDYDKYIELCHQAWIQNYIRWKGIRKDKLGKNPKRTLNTSMRNERATTHASNLEDNDIRVICDVIRIVFDILGKKILEAGMQQLAI